MSAPLPTPSGVIRTRLIHAIGQPGGNGCKFDMSYAAGPPGTDDLVIAAGQVRTAYAAHLASLLPSSYDLSQVTCVDLAHPETAEGTNTTVVAGSRSGVELPINCTMNVNFSIARRYRGSRPKFFAPWGVQADTGSNDSWGSTFITAVETQFAAFILALTGEVFGSASWGSLVGVSFTGEPYHVVISPTTGRGRNVGTPRNPPVVYPVTATTAGQILGSQRRRLR